MKTTLYSSNMYPKGSKSMKEWKRLVRIGSGDLPCRRLFELNSADIEGSGWTVLTDALQL